MQDKRGTATEIVVETALAYYRQGEALAKNATEAELMAWFSAFSDKDKVELVVLGAERWCTLASLKRYLLEAQGYFMRDYMLAHLASDELRYWVEEEEWPVSIG